ncbi:hypothetical protein FIV42_16040 [Persicimonas caeni]|uniref:Calcineurin-like phosphoesterase domain-containing protein n=1 Tax=Persicimonas caeni TaxID=2292766 RepID=A0A4Y6PV40_PERCE|nr:metallophosphoesterase [Persicimonas caeni]QDG52196.1 hypothetical protein FIV42_16040 [Persicimonas caeni]QED33418.1 hypothetical protein FRD00_16035 [Persicimonas caeni]
MKLIHLTDLHVSERSGAEYHHLRRLVAHIIEHHTDAVVVITGDLVDSGRADEFEVAAEILDALAADCRLMLVCPGNHDVEWMGTFGGLDRRPFGAFRRALTCAREGYPYCMTVDGVQITLIDTTAEARGLGDLARGRVGYRQRQELARYLETGQPHTRVVAGHHHLYDDDLGLELVDAAEMRAVCAHRCNLYLMGHDHHWGLWREVDGVGWIADGGKSTRPHRGRLRYRLFDITDDAISCNTQTIEV